MDIEGIGCMVTGGASGLGRACAELLAARGGKVVIVDLPTSDGAAVADQLGGSAQFVAADVTDESDMRRAVASSAPVPLRATIHCAGRSHAMRVLDKQGQPGALADYESVIRTNLVGSFNVLRLSAEAMAQNDSKNGDRGVIILTAS